MFVPPLVAVLYPFAEMVMGVGMRKLCLCSIVLAIAIVAALTPVAFAQDEEVKVSVLWTKSFDELSAYMYNTTDSKLYSIDTAKVQVLSDALKDLAEDDVQPCITLSLDAPTTDLNTNESIVYAIVLRDAYGTLIVGVADVNTTDNTVANLSFFKLSPVSGDVAIVRTSYDIVIEANEVKLSIPIENYSDPKVLIMTDGELYATSVNYIMLRALRNPPSGYTLIRSGSGETQFTISASGTLHIWFDETHDRGDVDLFVFDSSNRYYSEASVSRDWPWLTMHADARLFADAQPWTRTTHASGTVKFIVKCFSGQCSSVSWRIAARLESAPQTPPQPPTSTPTPSHSSTPTATPSPQANPAGLSGLIGRIENALSGSTALIIIVVLIIILLAIAIARR